MVVGCAQGHGEAGVGLLTHKLSRTTVCTSELGNSLFGDLQLGCAAWGTFNQTALREGASPPAQTVAHRVAGEKQGEVGLACHGADAMLAAVVRVLRGSTVCATVREARHEGQLTLGGG